MLKKDEGTVDFVWRIGDDTRETIELIENNLPLDLAGCTLDLFIVPDDRHGDPVIHLTRGAGLEVIDDGVIQITCRREKTRGATWKTAKWDLKITDAQNWRETKVGGKITRTCYYQQDRIKGWEDEKHD